MMVTMKHLKTETQYGDNSSCESDIDRQELIDAYGNETYLSKWNLEEADGINDGNPKIASHKQLGVYEQSEKLVCEKELQCLAIGEDNDDNASLVSYNSVKDLDMAVKKDTSTARYLPYQIQPTSQQVNLWQGYSGNIYFDPVRCQSMRINSSNPRKQKPKEHKNYRKTKSCSPSMELIANTRSFHSLGSLRFAPRVEKRTKRESVSRYGKLRKGFSDGKVTEKSLPGLYPRVRCESAPESLLISGRKDITTDLVNHVYQHNIQTSFSSKCKNSFPNIVTGRKCDSKPESTSLPRVNTAVVPSEKVAEPKPVFIIPFGALDDPVEERNSVTGHISKVKVSKNKSKVHRADILKEDNQVREESCSERNLEPGLSIGAPTTVKRIPDEENLTQRVDIPGVIDDIKTPRTFTVRREISDSSLSNYLQAVPTQLSKNTSNQPKKMPKLFYTKRSRDIFPAGSMSMNSMDDIMCPSDLRISCNTALYGGYLPLTSATDTRCRGEISSSLQTGETDLLRSHDANEQKVTNAKRLVKRNSNKSIASKNSQDAEKCHLPVIGWQVS